MSFVRQRDFVNGFMLPCNDSTVEQFNAQAGTKQESQGQSHADQISDKGGSIFLVKLKNLFFRLIRLYPCHPCETVLNFQVCSEIVKTEVASAV